jgi:hypothetical protein
MLAFGMSWNNKSRVGKDCIVMNQAFGRLRKALKEVKPEVVTLIH